MTGCSRATRLSDQMGQIFSSSLVPIVHLKTLWLPFWNAMLRPSLLSSGQRAVSDPPKPSAVSRRLARAAALLWYPRQRLQRETLRFNFPPSEIPAGRDGQWQETGGGTSDFLLATCCRGRALHGLVGGRQPAGPPGSRKWSLEDLSGWFYVKKDKLPMT